MSDAAIPGWSGRSGLPAVFYTEVAKGNVPGHSLIHKFGHGNVGTTMEPLCHSGVYMTPITAIALEIVSSDADDTAAGAGARTVFIEGLALDGSIVMQEVALNGLTAVAIPIPLWRLYRWYVMTSGTYATPLAGSHQGTLTIRVASAGATWSEIDVAPYPHGQSEIGWYTIPAGYRGYLLELAVTVDGAKSVDVMFLRRENANIVVAPFDAMRMVAQAVGVTGHSPIQSSNTPINGFQEFCDMGFVAKVASSTADVACHFELMLIKDGF